MRTASSYRASRGPASAEDIFAGCIAHGRVQLPEAQLRPALQLIRGRLDIERRGGRNLPSFGSLEANPDLAERSQEILRAEFGR